nr:adenine-specific methyltransferase [uncultured bacterium]
MFDTFRPRTDEVIACGDCVELMKEIPSDKIDLVVTDPPYLANYTPRDGRTVANDKNDNWLKPAFAEISRVMKPNSFCVSFYGWNKVDRFMEAWRQAGLTPVGHIVYAKDYASKKLKLAYRHECAYLLAKGQPEPTEIIDDVLGWKYSGDTFHPTQKPVMALEPLIRAFSKKGDMVLDPFCGSGSTLVAAKNLGRRFIGIDLVKDYCDVANKRVNQLHV